ATRDTDTMDTFVDSSWYFFRYCSPGYEDGPFDVEQVRKWMPVDQYTGGVEHAILHLLYSRFFTKVLYDMGMVDFTEPFRRLLNQGQVINQGKAMSKSLGNGVDLGEQIAEFGVDVVRLALLFAGPPEDDIDWADVSTHGMSKFLSRVHRIATEVSSDPGVDREPALHRRDRPDHGAGVGDPQGHRLRARPRRSGGPGGRRDRRGDAVAVRALHRRGGVGAAGPRGPGDPRGLAVRRPRP